MPSRTLDGVSGFSLFGRDYGWDDGDFWGGTIRGLQDANNSVDFTLESDNWYIRELRFRTEGTGSMDVTIDDNASGTENEIFLLDLGMEAGSAEVNLTDTRVRYIRGGREDVDITLNLGNQRTNLIELWESNNTISVGTGNVATMQLGDGVDNVTVSQGGNVDVIRTGDSNDSLLVSNTSWVGYADMGHQKNTVTVNGAGIGALRGGDGVDILSLRNNGDLDMASLGRGNNKITLTGDSGMASLRTREGNDVVVVKQDSWIDAVNLGDGKNKVTVTNNGSGIQNLRTGNGNDTVIVSNNGHINQADLGSGNNRVTISGDSRIGMLWTGDGNDTIQLNGAARIFALKMGQGVNTLTTSNGHLESIYSWNGTNTISIGSGGAGAIQLTGGGEDTVTTFDGWVQLIATGDDNDLVQLGSVGAGWVRLGDGDDRIELSIMNADSGVRIHGGDGSDTVDLSAYTNGLTINLDNGGAWQNPAAPGGDIDGVGQGYMRFARIENLIGSSAGDDFRGNDSDNVFEGRGGKDKLRGGGGNDTLIGGKGADTLWGGDDADTFQFNPGDGKDTIRDFEIGVDLIEITGANALEDLSFTTVGSNVRVEFGNNTIIVQNVTVDQLQDADNFIF